MVKNKKWHIKKIAALAGAVVLAVSSAALYAAPQVKAANGPCDTGDWAYAYINVKIGEDSTLIFSSKGTNSIAGMSYDRESNTLTLNDFKNKADDYSVGLLAEGTNSVLSVADTCNVTIYSGTKAAVYTSDNLTDKPIRDNGTLKENVSYNVSHPLEISRICAKYYEYDPYTTNTVYKSATDNTSLYYIKKLTYVEPVEKVTYTVYKFTAKAALGDVYYAEKIGEYDNIPAGYTETTLDKPVSYYESDGGSGGTCQVIINTATKEKYVSAYAYENNEASYRICKLLEKLGIDEKSNDELWLVDYNNPVATYQPVWGDDKLPDGYQYDGTEIDALYNVECVADKLTFTAKSADDNTIVDVSDGNTTIKADEIKKLIEDNKANDVVIKSNNDVTFTFAKGTMSEVSQVEIYDFSTAITSDIKEAGDMPEDVTEDIFVSKIVYNYSGALPARASIRLNVGKAYAGQTLYYSQLLDDGTIISMMSAIVDNDGYMTVEQDHCSTYLITRQQLTGNSTENVTEASDNKVETPQTGDNSNAALWLTLCIILSCGITLYIFAVKARKMNR